MTIARMARDAEEKNEKKVTAAKDSLQRKMEVRDKIV